MHNIFFVPMEGLEPPRLTADAPKASVSTIPPHRQLFTNISKTVITSVIGYTNIGQIHLFPNYLSEMTMKIFMTLLFLLSFVPSLDTNYTTSIDTNIKYVEVESLDVRDKKAFFIGDSQTSNRDGWGWQSVLCKKTGMKETNHSQIGKHTKWMVEKQRQYLDTTYDYCFIYGGANDIHGNMDPYYVVKNIQKMVDYAKSMGVTPVVLMGYNSVDVIRPIKGQEFYPKAYQRYQEVLLEKLVGVVIIDTRVLERKDCADWTCHMQPSGHRKVAEEVICQMNFKVIH